MVVERDGKEITLEGKVGTPTLEVETIIPLKGVNGKGDPILGKLG